MRDMLKISTTLKELNLSNNEIGAYSEYNDGRGPWVPSPEGPAALAEGLAANSCVTQVDVSNNRLRPEGGKALADCLKINTTITQVR